MNPLHIIEQYYTVGTPLYDTLVLHSESVTRKALLLAGKHPELALDIEFVAEAAMLHDVGIYQTYAPTIFCFGTHAYIEHGYLGADLLRACGLEKHALVAERHTGTGLPLATIEKQQLPLPRRDMCPISLEEQLICYADKFFSKTRLTEEASIDKIRHSLSKFGDESVAQFDYWSNLFG